MKFYDKNGKELKVGDRIRYEVDHRLPPGTITRFRIGSPKIMSFIYVQFDDNDIINHDSSENTEERIWAGRQECIVKIDE